MIKKAGQGLKKVGQKVAGGVKKLANKIQKKGYVLFQRERRYL